MAADEPAVFLAADEAELFLAGALRAGAFLALVALAPVLAVVVFLAAALLVGAFLAGALRAGAFLAVVVRADVRPAVRPRPGPRLVARRAAVSAWSSISTTRWTRSSMLVIPRSANWVRTSPRTVESSVSERSRLVFTRSSTQS